MIQEAILNAGSEQPQNTIFSRLAHWFEKSSLFQTLVHRLNSLLILTGTLALLGGFFYYFSSARQLQLIAWEEYATLYPDRVTDNLSLPLSYSGTPAKDVRLVTIHIASVGSNYLGDQQSRWTIDVSCDASNVVVLAAPTIVPSSTIFSLREPTVPNIVSLNLGVLEPRSEIIMKVMVVNPAMAYGRCTVRHNLLGVPQPDGGGSLWAQFANRFWPLSGFFSFILMTGVLVEAIKNAIAKPQKRLWLHILGLLIGCVVGAIFMAVIMTMGFGVVAEWLFRAPSLYDAVVEWFR
jgi:hypothetical protein